MKHSHGSHGAPADHIATNGASKLSHNLAKSAAISAGAHTGRTVMQKLSRHPLILFGIGVAAGYYVHKYRKEIIACAAKATDKGKDFVLQQKESLEDIVAESQESQEES